jgi:hypothetical protein
VSRALPLLIEHSQLRLIALQLSAAPKLDIKRL